jgi:hypothetical protein
MIAKTEDFIRKNIAGQKTKQAQSRRKMLDKLERLERPEDVWLPPSASPSASRPRRARATSSSTAPGSDAERGGAHAVRRRRAPRASRRAHRHRGPERIAGKTTLLKLLADRGGPGRPRVVKRGTNLQDGYFDQHLGEVDPTLTAVDNVRSIRGDFTVEAARQYLARFRFWGDDPLRVGAASRAASARASRSPSFCSSRATSSSSTSRPTTSTSRPRRSSKRRSWASRDGDPRGLARSPLPRERRDARGASGASKSSKPQLRPASVSSIHCAVS